MILIKSLLSLHSIPSKNSVYEKKESIGLQSPTKRRDRELELIDNLLGSGQSIYELCAILGLNPKTKPILFFENLLILKNKNKQIEQYNKELQQR